MAHTARISALTDELIRCLVAFDPVADKQAYKHAKDIASKRLRGHHFARTNQFDIEASYVGLDEKFRVKDRDDLADALQDRLHELQHVRSKYMPEFLSLLLQLSDRPTEKSNVEALQLLRPPTPQSPLTWQKILDDDPYSDEEIWRDIDYAEASSEDEQPVTRGAKSKTQPVTHMQEDDTYNPESCVVPADESLVKQLEEAQFWTAEPEEEDGTVDISELQAVKETLFMLSGVQTSLYHTDRGNTTIRVSQKYTLNHAINTTVEHLLVDFARIGRDLYHLRQWTKRQSSLPLIQTFEAAVIKALANCDMWLAQLQKKYLVPDKPFAVSLLELHAEVQSTTVPILRLAQIVADIEPELLVNPFIHLETLFEQITLAQMTLQKSVFDFLGTIFFESLQTYLKPIRKWMASGELGANDETFFVFENDPTSEASSLWHDRFVLRRGQGNTLRSPSFLHPAAQRIFNTGKSVVFLKEMGIYGRRLDAVRPESEPEPRLDFESVCGSASGLPISPFPDLFQASFQVWIRSKYSLAATILRTHLFEEYGLMKLLNDFNTIYLGADGSIFQDFADAVFERMDMGQRAWNDRFLLTELARGIYSAVLGRSNADKIMVRSVRFKKGSKSVKELGSIFIDYALPWPIQNIIQRTSIPIYQQFFSFLLQTYRAKYLLQRVELPQVTGKESRYLSQLSFKLRQHLIWFVDTLRSYLTETVITLSTVDMRTAMAKTEDIDEMSNIHIKYVARLQDQALLSENLKPIHKPIISILDLAVLFAEAQNRQRPQLATTKASISSSQPKQQAKTPTKAAKRKSFIPAIVESDTSSDSDEDYEHKEVRSDENVKKKGISEETSLKESLKMIDRELERLLPFVTAGLKNVGRVGAEPVWEMLAERLEWEKKDR